MATILAKYSVQFVDYLGVPVSHLIFIDVPDTTTLATLSSVMASYNTLLGNIAGGKGVSSQIAVNGPISGLGSTAVAGDENEKTGLFNFGQSGSVYKQGVDVPGIRETKITNGKIDLTDTDIAAWVAWFLVSHTGIVPVSPYSLAFTALLDALISFRKHRKAESRRSLEPGT